MFTVCEHRPVHLSIIQEVSQAWQQRAAWLAETDPLGHTLIGRVDGRGAWHVIRQVGQDRSGVTPPPHSSSVTPRNEDMLFRWVNSFIHNRFVHVVNKQL